MRRQGRDAIAQITTAPPPSPSPANQPLTNAAVHRRDTGSLTMASTFGRGSPVHDMLAPVYVASRAASSAPRGFATLTFDTPQQICPGLPPPDAPPRLYAFEIPETIGETRVDRVEAVIDGVRRRDDYGHMSRPFADAYRPRPLAHGPRVATSEQGFLILMTQRGELAVSWNTYDAEGEQLWVSGIGSFIDPQSTLAYVSLNDTGGGAFGQHPGPAGPFENWGTMELDYLRCGRLHATWTPAAHTNLDAGEAEFQQLTAPWSDPCDLAGYAEAKGLTAAGDRCRASCRRRRRRPTLHAASARYSARHRIARCRNRGLALRGPAPRGPAWQQKYQRADT